MATSTCQKCEGTSFELKENEPYNSEYKLNFVQCRNCGTVVGVLDFWDTGALLHKLAKALNIKL